MYQNYSELLGAMRINHLIFFMSQKTDSKNQHLNLLHHLNLDTDLIKYLEDTGNKAEVTKLASQAIGVDASLRTRNIKMIQAIIDKAPATTKLEAQSIKDLENESPYIQIRGAKENNLKDISIKIPLKCFVAITGVSGSGKSTLINDILSNYLMNYFYDSRLPVGEHSEIFGLENIDKAIIIDQSPIGRTPRSNPATYTKLFDPIRTLFAELPESRARGYLQGRFSFNVPGGRCETCEGDGSIKVEMKFLPDVYVTCEDCNGQRYNKETLEIKFKDKNIADILAMSVAQALVFFENHTTVFRRLSTMHSVGLDYLTLGQPATTLSGGEAQRIKLSTELSKIGTGDTLYILDEPTTGLHPLDVKQLLGVLHKLVDKGNTVLVIEHNLDVIKTADWIIDLGPEGGDKGGMIVGSGTPEQIAKTKDSYTGQYLANTLKKHL